MVELLEFLWHLAAVGVELVLQVCRVAMLPLSSVRRYSDA